MKSGNILFSAVHFFMLFFLLVVGLVFVVLPYTDNFRVFLINSLINHLSLYKSIGYCLVGASCLLFLGLYRMNCCSFLQMEMNAIKVEIDKKLIQKIVETYWKGLFPKHETSVDIVIKEKQKLELMVTLPEEKDENFFICVQKELGSLLARQFGYQKPFILTLSETL